MPDQTAICETRRDTVDAAALYFGDVMHARLKPVGHRFRYRVMSLLIDLDQLDAADRQSPLFGVNRSALYSFNEADHGERDGSRLRIYAQRCAAECGIDLTGGRVLLLCYPRLFGYTFNPLSAYFCHRAGGELALIIYEVRNTFGDIHAYVLPVKPGESSAAGVRQAQDKLFYVSPFIEMAMRYHFRVSPPGDNVKLRILETDREGPLLAATFSGRRRALTTAALLRSLFSLPLVTLKIVAAIHWEAALAQGSAPGTALLCRTGKHKHQGRTPSWRPEGATIILRPRYLPSGRSRVAGKRAGPVKVESEVNRPTRSSDTEPHHSMVCTCLR